MKRCVHCDPQSFALSERLKETEHFWVACDIHPLVEGHILIVPKPHISCVGAFEPTLFAEFNVLYKNFSDFLKKTYGSVSSFEHGILGQTVFHAHMHLLPFVGKTTDIVPEGNEKLVEINNIAELQNKYKSDAKYLFFSIDSSLYFVDHALGVPRFFPGRFARALGTPERGNWKDMEHDQLLMTKAVQEVQSLMRKWWEFSK